MTHNIYSTCIRMHAVENINLTGKFLIAMPAMTDPLFSQSLVYICEHDANGALGVIVNRPIDMSLGLLYESIDINLSCLEYAEQPVFFGGPVQSDHGFVLHRPLGKWKTTLRINSEIGLTCSLDILESIANGEFAKQDKNTLMITLGYAGWSSMQLEEEIKENAWLSLNGHPSLIFETPINERVSAAMAMLGFDSSQLSNSVGHA